MDTRAKVKQAVRKFRLNTAHDCFNKCFPVAKAIARVTNGEIIQVAGFLGDPSKALDKWSKLQPEVWTHYVVAIDGVVFDPTAEQFVPGAPTEYPIEELFRNWSRIYRNIPA